MSNAAFSANAETQGEEVQMVDEDVVHWTFMRQSAVYIQS